MLQGQCDTGVCQPSVNCVGAFGEFGTCSNVCGAGEHSKFYTIVSHTSRHHCSRTHRGWQMLQR